MRVGGRRARSTGSARRDSGRRSLRRRCAAAGGIRTPMLVRWPGVVKPGSVSNFTWAFWDFFPTAADVAGVIDQVCGTAISHRRSVRESLAAAGSRIAHRPGAQVPRNIDGQSILPTLRGQPQDEHSYLYWEFCTNVSIAPAARSLSRRHACCVHLTHDRDDGGVHACCGRAASLGLRREVGQVESRVVFSRRTVRVVRSGGGRGRAGTGACAGGSGVG